MSRQPLLERVPEGVVERTRLVFGPGTSPSAICKGVQALDLRLPHNLKFAVQYAIEETATNAVRASAEKLVSEPVIVEMLDDGRSIRVTVQDAAGGFDVKALPYDFAANAEEVDVNSEAFERHRAKYGERRFGLGLLTARSMVKDFSLAFVDAAGRETTWRGEGSVHGTCVSFRVERDENQRSTSRHPVAAAAAMQDGLRAHVCDLSLGGAALVITTNPAPRLDEVYQLRLAIADEPALEAKVSAKISRVERVGACFRVGAEFEGLDERAVAALTRIISRIEAFDVATPLAEAHIEHVRPDREPERSHR
jgi:anti-sigma regulatory factor (Ser/Thr protein kinase)